ncbi:hypothetical protein [Halobacillus sp. Marseille-Q1614]|uniref:hypothetical protein n=1 Tax=Halobacillus sp. Marseille-Q1614 TaxID=2709134 RepID=UPI001570E0C8|nr:hypothetical protein [Halobacillus sp. Marseille-Q1614]
MAFTYSKIELIQDLQKVFVKHNVQSVKVQEPGTLFLVGADGSLKIGTGATILAFETPPGDKLSKFKLIRGGNKKEE